MDITKEIKKKISKINHINESKSEAYKKKLLEDIRVNLLVKKQPIEANQHLVDRYRGVKPQPLTTMQQALQDACDS